MKCLVASNVLLFLAVTAESNLIEKLDGLSESEASEAVFSFIDKNKDGLATIDEGMDALAVHSSFTFTLTDEAIETLRKFGHKLGKKGIDLDEFKEQWEPLYNL